MLAAMLRAIGRQVLEQIPHADAQRGAQLV
jgi:hypothetical protein